MKSFVFGLVWFIILGADSSAPLMVSEVAKEIKEQNIKFPKIVLAQALHEASLTTLGGNQDTTRAETTTSFSKMWDTQQTPNTLTD